MKTLKVSRAALFCFFSVYIVWGSTYLAIRIAIETIPALTLTSFRFFLAAAIMSLIARIKNEPPLDRAEKKIAALTGILLILGNAIVCIVEYWVPSGIVAVIIGSMPIWMMLIGWVSFNQGRPNAPRLLGALIGLAGVALIASGNAAPMASTSAFSQYGMLLLCGSGILWSTGTLLQRRLPKVKSLFRFSGTQMLSGAIVAAILCLIFERPWESPFTPSAASLGAALYLVVFGSIVGFTAYSWLSRNVEPHLVSTYALVNPVIAVALGWLIFSEPITASFIGATILVLVGLSLLMLDWKKILAFNARP